MPEIIFTQKDMELAAILGKKFGNLSSARSVVDMIRTISDIDVSQPYDANTMAKVMERLHQYGYDSEEAYQVVWAIREQRG
jgi:hypothetical protein